MNTDICMYIHTLIYSHRCTFREAGRERGREEGREGLFSVTLEQWLMSCDHEGTIAGSKLTCWMRPESLTHRHLKHHHHTASFLGICTLWSNHWFLGMDTVLFLLFKDWCWVLLLITHIWILKKGPWTVNQMIRWFVTEGITFESVLYNPDNGL